jgi:hypothetical protein
MFLCFKRKHQILGGILVITIVYFVLQFVSFIFYSVNNEKQHIDSRNAHINPKFNILNRLSIRNETKIDKQIYLSPKKKAQLQIPFISNSNSDLKQPELFYLLPYILQRQKFNLTIINVDYSDFNNFETTQTSAFIRGIDRQKANSYLPNFKGFFRCLDSNVSTLK